MKLTAIIEKGSDGGFTVYSKEYDFIIGSGWSKEEAIADFGSALAELSEFYKKRDGKYPKWANAEIEYKYDIAAFFQSFPFINVSKFAEFVGINPSLMRKYKNGIAYASPKQLGTIQNGLTAMVDQLQSVHL